MKNTENGIAQIALVLILIAGLGVGLYLVRNSQIFKPRATVSGPSAQFVDLAGNKITQTADSNVMLRIIRVSSAADPLVSSPTPPAPEPASTGAGVYPGNPPPDFCSNGHSLAYEIKVTCSSGQNCIEYNSINPNVCNDYYPVGNKCPCSSPQVPNSGTITSCTNSADKVCIP